MNKNEVKLQFQKSIFYLLKEESSFKLILIAPNQENENAQKFGEVISEEFYYGTMVSEVLSSLGSLIIIDPYGNLFRFFINLKIISYLGMINVYFGEVLETFLLGAAKSSFPKSKLSK